MNESHALASVLEFYKSLPFNYRGSAKEQAERDTATNPLDHHTALAEVIKPGMRVLDLGCGAGWFSNAMARHCDVRMTGLDFNPVAVGRARQVADILGLDVEFIEGDLFGFRSKQPFQVVVSMGVLHHTGDCAAGFRHICRNLLAPGGYAYIGLYHTYGRKPFLDHFASLKANGASEEDLYQEYRSLHQTIKDETMLRSWFRDQVLHPHETQHTQSEMNALLQDEGMELAASSINRFQPFSTPSELDAMEPLYEERAQGYLRQRQYFPGFFLFLAKKGNAYRR